VVLKTEYYAKFVGNTWKILKCGAGEGWRRSFGPIVREMKKCYMELKREGMSYIQQNGMVTSCVRAVSITRYWRKERWKKWREDEEEEVSSYWI